MSTILLCFADLHLHYEFGRKTFPYIIVFKFILKAYIAKENFHFFKIKMELSIYYWILILIHIKLKIQKYSETHADFIFISPFAYE